MIKKKSTAIKRPSNNPNGRPPAEDKKVFVGIYVLQSYIDKRGDKDAVRDIFRKAIKK